MHTHDIPLHPSSTTAASTSDHVVLWHFSQRLYALCRTRGLTVTELARQAGLSTQESYALQGKLLLHDPGLSAVVLLARTLQVSPLVFFS